MGHLAADEGGLRRVLGPFSATCVVVGAIVGVGIFFTPSSVARLAGSPQMALLAWAVGGLIAMLGALTFASLGSVYHSSGAQYEILRDAYGPLPAFLFVFCNATAIQAGSMAIIAIVCVDNLALAVGVGGELGDAPRSAIALGLIGLLTIANAVGVRWGAGVQAATVIAKVAALVAIGVLAAMYGGSASAADGAAATSTVAGSASPSLAAALLMAVVPTFFAYGGWQHALWVSGEVRDPRRNLPRAIIVGVLIVLAVYLLAAGSFFALLGYAGVCVSRSPAADAVGRVWAGVGQPAMAAVVAVSAFGVLNAQLLSGPRLVQRLASDGLFFGLFSRIGPRGGTPVAAIVLLSMLAAAMLLGVGFQGVDKLLTGVVFVDGVFFMLTGAAPFVLRRRAGERMAAAFWLGYPATPALFVIGELALLCGAYLDAERRAATYVGAGWIAAGVVFYALFRRFGHSRPAAA